LDITYTETGLTIDLAMDERVTLGRIRTAYGDAALHTHIAQWLKGHERSTIEQFVADVLPRYPTADPAVKVQVLAKVGEIKTLLDPPLPLAAPPAPVSGG
jgi:hypothetical protein